MAVLAHQVMAADEESRKRRHEELERVLGATITHALGRWDVVEVLVNSDGRVWLDSLVDGMVDSGLRLCAHEVEDLCVTVASELGKTIDAEHPSLIGELPIDGSRVQGLFPPIVPAPTVAIRKRASRVMSLEEYVQHGVLARNHYEFLRHAVVARQNVVFVGGTGSGKTTLGNALLGAIAELMPQDRLVILEDTFELQTSSANVVRLRKSQARTMTQLLTDAMRLRPDRIIVGECRDASAFDFLMALNTGHKGSFTTVHANSPREALTRLENLVRLAQQPVIPSMLADAIDALIFIQRVRGVFRITELVRLAGVAASGAYELQVVDPQW